MASPKDTATTHMRISSAEEPDDRPLVDPEHYRPHRADATAEVDDDLADTEPLHAWRDYRASGSNQSHWFLIGRDGTAHLVETTVVDGRYEASGPGYRHQFDNAYDAFWTAEALAKTFTGNGRGRAAATTSKTRTAPASWR